MANLTITLDDGLLRRARRVALAREITLTELIRGGSRKRFSEPTRRSGKPQTIWRECGRPQLTSGL